jgi:catechol 2,3-dioxygenase-like lactoylglutathione lyase family enzyme
MPAGTAGGRRPVCRLRDPTTKDAVLTVRFNHVAVAAKDKRESATFLANLLGLAEPTAWGPFSSVALDDGVRLDYAEPGIEFPGQHYALLVSDDVFDRALERIKAWGVRFWADPAMRSPNEINTNHGGRGIYFDDPSGHHFELITQPYGTAR